MLLLLLLMALVVGKPSLTAVLLHCFSKRWNEGSWLAELSTERKCVVSELVMSACGVMLSLATIVPGIEICLYLPDSCSTRHLNG
jgi:hypothetical protein